MLTKMSDTDFRMRAWEIVIAEEQAKEQAKPQVNEEMKLNIPSSSSSCWEIAIGWTTINSRMIMDAAWTEEMSHQASIACSTIVGRPYAVTLIQGVAGDLHAWKYHSTQYYNTDDELKIGMAKYCQVSAIRWWPCLLEGNSQQLDRGMKLKQLVRLQLTITDALCFFSEWLQTICPSINDSNSPILHFPYFSAAWATILSESGTSESDQLGTWHQLPTWLCVRQRM